MPVSWGVAKGYSMEFYKHFETGTGSVGDCPAFDRKYIEDDAAGLSCREMLGGIYERE